MKLLVVQDFTDPQALEQCFRDIQAERYHPLQSAPQAKFAGASALGLTTEYIYYSLGLVSMGELVALILCGSYNSFF